MSLSTVVARIAQLDAMLGHSSNAWAAWSSTSAGDASGSAGAAAAGQSAGGTSATNATASSTGTRFVDVYDGAFGPSPASSAVGASGSTSDVPANGRFLAPVSGATLTQAFGPTSFALEPAATVNGVYYAHYHDGLDLAAPLGTPVRAAAAGTVISAGPGYAGCVIVKIRHDDGSVSLYGHLQTSLQVAVGQRVDAGQQIGQVGVTGNTTGPHLHFGLFDKNGQAIDPQPWLDAGRLPGAVPASTSSASLATPSATNPATMTWETTQAGLARFDAISSRIPFAAQIRAAAVANGIDPLLLASLVHAESDFQPNVVSSCGAMGLTQLMPATARYLGVGDPFDPAQNLAGGAKYLSQQLKRFGRVDLALAAYNAGPTAVANAGRVPSYAQGYVDHILSTWTAYAEKSA